MMLTYNSNASDSPSGKGRTFDFTAKACVLEQGFVPLEIDIVCGRGNAYSNRPGNKFFSRVCRNKLQEYVEAPTRAEKSRVVSSVLIQVLGNGARFVKMDRTSKLWYQMSKEQAHDKTGHAMRDMIRLYASGDSENVSASKYTVSPVRTKQSLSSEAVKMQTVPGSSKCRRPKRNLIVLAEPETVVSFEDLFLGSSRARYSLGGTATIFPTLLNDVHEVSVASESGEDSDSMSATPTYASSRILCPYPMAISCATPFVEIDDNQFEQARPALDLSFPLSADTFFEDNTEPQPIFSGPPLGLNDEFMRVIDEN